MSADRNLLLGLLALQLDFISREQLLTGMRLCADDPSRPLSAILLSAGTLAAADQQVLEALVERHLAVHAGDPQQSLAAVRSTSSQPIDDIYVTLSADRSTEIRGSTSLKQGYAIPADRRVNPSGSRYLAARPYREGGLGTVSIALDNELDREVALKEMKPKLADDSRGRARFVREAEITGGLEHPNIVPVYGLGAHPDGRPFYAMRLIRGDTSLADELKTFHAPGRDPFAADQNLRLRTLLQRFIAVCDAIEYAHARGVIHRDLKPANIMLGRFGETLVVDWGLAKLLSASGDDPAPGAEPRLRIRSQEAVDATAMGSALGTPAFMAPEQAEGRLDLLGPATDVYGLGATLYSLLTGQLPVKGKSADEVLESVRKGDVVSPRSRVRTLPAPLAAICMKALAHQPENRYASAKELAADLSRFLADEPVTAYRDPPLVRARRWARKRPALTSGALAATVVTLIGLLIGFVVVQQKNRELVEKEAIATGVKDFLLKDLFQLAAASAQAEANLPVDPNLKVVALLRHSQAKLDQDESSNQPQVRADLQSLISRGLKFVDSQLTIRETVVRATAQVQQRFQTQPRLQAQIHHELGNALTAIAEFPRALEQFTEARDLAVAHWGPRHPSTLRTMAGLAGAYTDLGRFPEAIALLEQTLPLRESVLGPTHRDTLRSMVQLADAYSSYGRSDKAIPLYQRALELQQKTLGAEDQETLVTMQNLAVAYREAGRPAKALPLAEEVLRVRRSKLGPKHPDTLWSMNGLVESYLDANRLEEAIPLCEEVWRERKARLGSQHSETLESMHNLALALKDVGRTNEAIALLTEAIELLQTKRGPTHMNTLTARMNLALAYSQTSRLDEAVPHFEDVLKGQRLILAPTHIEFRRALTNLAFAYQKQGRILDAIPLYEELLALQKDQLGFYDPVTQGTKSNLAKLYAEAKGATDDPADAAMWQEKLDELQPP